MKFTDTDLINWYSKCHLYFPCNTCKQKYCYSCLINLQVRYSFSRKRRMFGAQYKFTSTQCDDDSETCVNISSVPGVNLELQRMEMEIGVQV